MITLSGKFQQAPYTLYLGKDLLLRPELLLPGLPNKQVLILSHPSLAPYHKQLRKNFLGYQCNDMVLPSGEQEKSLRNAEKVISFLIEKSHQRQSTLIALGGGVIGDLGGFISAIYLRGINFIYIPTTLLAQVDATLGGKCAVNHATGKNLIGTFHHPSRIIIDINTLLTLSDRAFYAGLAEAIKHGIALDEAYFTWLEEHIDQIRARDPDTLITLIQKSLVIKKNIVEADEKDLAGKRALLNFGHTFGHAIEHATNYQLLHGESVSMGMQIAAHISYDHQLICKNTLDRIGTLLRRAGLYEHLPHCEIDLLAYKQALLKDKKNTGNALNMILLTKVGHAFQQEVNWLSAQKYFHKNLFQTF